MIEKALFFMGCFKWTGSFPKTVPVLVCMSVKECRNLNQGERGNTSVSLEVRRHSGISLL